MGQKVNPISLRLNIVRTWDSIWYADRDYAKYFLEDQKVRKYLKKRLYHAGIAKIEIARTGDMVYWLDTGHVTTQRVRKH